MDTATIDRLDDQMNGRHHTILKFLISGGQIKNTEEELGWGSGKADNIAWQARTYLKAQSIGHMIRRAVELGLVLLPPHSAGADLTTDEQLGLSLYSRGWSGADLGGVFGMTKNGAAKVVRRASHKLGAATNNEAVYLGMAARRLISDQDLFEGLERCPQLTF
jgi:hypothetical protein